MFPKLFSGFSTKTPSELLFTGGRVVENMTRNASMFTEAINAEVVELGKMNVIMNDLMEKAQTRDSMAVSQKNAYVPQYRHKLKMIATLINLRYPKDLPTMEGTGFTVLLAPHKRKMTKIDNLYISQSSQEGYIKVRVSGAEYCHSLTVEVSTESTFSNDTTQVSQQTRKTFELGPYAFGTQVYIRVVALGKDNSTVRSRVHPYTVSYSSARTT